MSSTAESIRTEQPQPQTSAGQLERLPRTRDTIVVQSNIPTLDTAMFEHMQRIATMMAQSSLVPAHLNVERKEGNQVVQLSSKEAIANCFLVVNQAIRWNMDPFAVAQHAYTTKGRLGWEGKMIAAVINTHQMIEERLSYAYSGTGDQRKVVVTAKIRGDKEPRSVEGTVASWRTTGTNSPWDKQSQWDQQLSYRGAREWARRHLPEAILGVWGDDEIQQFEATERTLAGEQHHDRPTRGPDGLRAAMGSTDTTDATVVSETKKGEPTRAGTPPAAGATNAARVDTVKAASTGDTGKSESGPAPKPKEKPKGTLERLEHYTKWFAKAKDADELDLARDEARGYEWTKEDEDSIVTAYSQAQDRVGRL